MRGQRKKDIDPILGTRPTRYPTLFTAHLTLATFVQHTLHTLHLHICTPHTAQFTEQYSLGGE